MAKILKFIRLPASDRQLLVKSAFLLIVVRLMLLLIPFKTLLTIIDNIKPKIGGEGSVEGISPDRVAWAVLVAGRHIPFVRCLCQAVAAKILFAKQGFPAQLRIGVAKNGKNQLKAHAWVESLGEIVIGNSKDLSQFKILPSLKCEKL